MWTTAQPAVFRIGARVGQVVLAGTCEQTVRQVPSAPQPAQQRRRRPFRSCSAACEPKTSPFQQHCGRRPEPIPAQALPQPAEVPLVIAGSGVGIDGEYLPKGKAGGLPKWERADGAALYAIGSLWAATDASRRTVLARSEAHSRRPPAEMEAWQVRGTDGAFIRQPAMQVRRQAESSPPPAPAVLLVPVPQLRSPEAPPAAQPAQDVDAGLCESLEDMLDDDDSPPPLVDGTDQSDPSTPVWWTVGSAGPREEWPGGLEGFLSALEQPASPKLQCAGQ
eukprot:TRINITY_DN685_c6_g1_i1.p1 TRINITY_DN685_c6_g1~~TRINITY_DN685_c6_g1_i1.p1  ORF type:complete len:279 (+),score=101.90 TRINITY_DN685_c6_g1_i1:237-1073(+)